MVRVQDYPSIHKARLRFRYYAEEVRQEFQGKFSIFADSTLEPKAMGYKKRIYSSREVLQIALALAGLAMVTLFGRDVSWVCFARADSLERQGPKSEPSAQDIEAAVQNAFGSKVRVMASDHPFFLTGDYNGDGNADIAILVNIENGREGLTGHGVKFIDIDPHSKQNGVQIDPLSTSNHNCVGVAIIHGTPAGWMTSLPGNRYMFYECFSPFRLIHRKQRLRRGADARGPTPVLQGDAIELELETGGRTIVYWNGRTYRGFSRRIGD
jgi:hypothetical protein